MRTNTAIERPGHHDRGAAGFTLLELTVALAISSTILIFVLNLLDMANDVGRLQTDLAGVQQTQRVVHNLLADSLRLAGRGGLPPNLAVNVADNVGADYQVGGNATVEGTDVLRIRGAFETLFVVNAANNLAFNFDETTKDGFVVVDSVMPTGIARQPLDAIETALADNRPVPLVIVSTRSNDTLAVVELGSDSSVGPADVDGDGSIASWEKRAVLRFSADPAKGVNNAVYTALSSDPTGWPDQLTRAAVVGILQEYQFYLRPPEGAVDGGLPMLARAQLYPGTDQVVGDASNGRVTMADAVIDLQFARAFDADLDFRLDEDPDSPETDEWLGNHPQDQIPSVVGFAEEAQLEALGWPVALMTHVQISTMVRTARPDLGFVSERLIRFQNREYDEDTTPTGADLIERRYRRRQLTTVVDVRNL